MKEEELIKIIKKFTNTPGKCSVKEVEEVKKFFSKYKTYVKIYKEATNSDVVGLSLESSLDKVDWYIKFLKNKERK
jgi:hypothetical protein